MIQRPATVCMKQIGLLENCRLGTTILPVYFELIPTVIVRRYCIHFFILLSKIVQY